jgi:hypothetical protein
MPSPYRTRANTVPIKTVAGGSCTGYGVSSALEGITKIAHGDCPKLSEKDLFFCADGKCSEGTTMQAALDKAKRGVATLECCPNGNMPLGQDSPCGGGRCSEWWNKGAVKAASWRQLGSVEEAKQALDQGPIPVAFIVYQSFMNYTGGVYRKLPAGDSELGGHCVSLWGYDDAQGCFLMRNSWGTGWGETKWGLGEGERGWCRIAYSEIDYLYVMEPDGPVDPDPPSPCRVGKAVAWFLNLIVKALGRKGKFYYLTPCEGCKNGRG